MLLDQILQYIPIVIILAVSLGMHEYAHAYIAYKLGDPTAKLAGRLTPNPLKHIDPIGFLMIFFIHFGWAKPVPFNPMYFKNPLKGELMTSLAGPAMNMLLAILGMIIILSYSRIVGIAPTDIFVMNQLDPMNMFRMLFAQINIMLAVFNLIPIFPLDGYRLIKIFRKKASDKMEQYPMYSFATLILILLVLANTGILLIVTEFIFKYLFMLFGQIFY